MPADQDMPTDQVMPTDDNRFLRFNSPLGKDLICTRFTGKEEMGRLYEYQLTLFSLDHDIKFKKMVGQPVCVKMELPEQGDDVFRYFHGYVTEFRYMGFSGRHALYEATVKPWLWFLSRTADCRIFQNRPVPDIIKQVFRDNGMSDFEDELNENYRKWEYCVQYRESDFDFVSRLMEQEGIFYYFKHEEGKHILVLADGLSAYDTFPGYETVPYYPPDTEDSRRERDHLYEWSLSQSIMPEKYTTSEFDFEKPKVDLQAQHKIEQKHAHPHKKNEIFDYPGEYTEIRDGDNYARIRTEEMQAQFERAKASGTAKGMCVGYYFTLENFPRESENKDHLIISVQHDIQCDAAESVSNLGGGDHYYCAIEVMDLKKNFRSQCLTPRPFVRGPQTAIVVGPSSEEIYCDKHGRVKVQFHWDREGKSNENSSCWVRVSQTWAGQNWGSIHIPRVDQEVVVSFLEGDPDRPIITGRVYNEINKPPYTLEENKTQSGIKSSSTKNGTKKNFNEIRFEDKKGEEELFIQAEKDRNILVKNDDTLTVHGKSVGRKIEITQGHHTLAIDTGNQDITVSKGNQTTEVKKGKISVTAAQSIEFKCGGSTINMDPSSITLKSTNITVQATAKIEVKGAMVDVNGSGMVTVKGGLVKIN
jgi:type VI secretion system secreted protein VgrG